MNAVFTIVFYIGLVFIILTTVRMIISYMFDTIFDTYGSPSLKRDEEDLLWETGLDNREWQAISTTVQMTLSDKPKNKSNHCKYCGSKNSSDADNCKQCGAPL